MTADRPRCRNALALAFAKPPPFMRGEAGEDVSDQTTIVCSDIEGGQGEHPELDAPLDKLVHQQHGLAGRTAEAVQLGNDQLVTLQQLS